MPPDAKKTRENILESAKCEFLQHGFSRTSLRTIAQKAGVTTGALYRHFSDKNALFDALVGPVKAELVATFEKQTDAYIRGLETEGLEPMWNKAGWNVDDLVLYMYDHFDAFRLLLFSSGKSSSEDFMHTLIDLEVDSTIRYLTEAKRQGYPVGVPRRQEAHMLANAQFSALFELVMHEIPKEDGLEYARTVSRFFAAGWKEIICR